MELDVSENVDPGHAFYLGFEMAKASLALLLGKQYEQDQPLQLGILDAGGEPPPTQESSQTRTWKSLEYAPAVCSSWRMRRTMV